ncbi:glycosyltransferase family 2 protein [Novosphingobium sp. G106]|uniref:glycosyltransferase family 2 protein n=1 Tax=Novosphingobium sp. G106 TaxID=2849500 RepID=UPI001C2CCEBC|nr:glycosyltransferase family 2 protein [Novosphingobium sp. G106]MBV1690545.1 glycosyltransferase family 2 protein [Novosphingobium sp. G106]
MLRDCEDARWSVVVPVFNERDFLPRTLLSLARQTVPFTLIVVDNGSTDGCIAAARVLATEHGLDALFLEEPTPGQVHALKRGIAAASGEFVAICDADTWYPPHYLERAGQVFGARGQRCVAVAACNPSADRGLGKRLTILHRLIVSQLLYWQNHTSGACQTFRLSALRAAGGYDGRLWPYVLKDHELMNRVLRLGTQAYDRALWCVPSARRHDRSGVRWTLGERLLYHVTPYRWQRALFHRFLAPRFAARGLRDTALRAQPWRKAA